MYDDLMKIDSRLEGGRLALRVSGECDLSNAATLRAALEQAAADGVQHVTLDLSAVTFFDSSGLAVLEAASRLLDGRLELVAGDLVLQLLRISGLESLLDVRPAPPQAG